MLPLLEDGKIPDLLIGQIALVRSAHADAAWRSSSEPMGTVVTPNCVPLAYVCWVCEAYLLEIRTSSTVCDVVQHLVLLW